MNSLLTVSARVAEDKTVELWALADEEKRRQRIEGRAILVLDDVVNSGRTLIAVKEKIQRYKPASIKTLVLARKATTRPREAEADYALFNVDPDVRLVGVRIDYEGRFWELDHLACLPGEFPDGPRVGETMKIAGVHLSDIPAQ